MNIAFNTQQAGHRNRGYAESMTREQVDSLLAEDWLRKMVADIRGGDEKKKDLLPYLCPHYSAFSNNHRAQKDIIAEAFTFMTCIDVDDKSLVDKAIKRALELNGDAYSDWQDQVLRIEYSARKKVHIYIRIPKGMTIEEAQRAFCKEMEVPFDESCITPERFIYVTGKDEEIFRSPHWLESLSDEEVQERREAYLQRGLDVDGRPVKTEDGRGKTEEGSHPADARTLFIFDACMKEAELTADMLIVEGHRHEALKSILSVGATQLLTKPELMGVLKVRMPRNWQDKNIQDLVSDFYSKYHDPSQKMTQFQRKVLAKSLKMVQGEGSLVKGRPADVNNHEPSTISHEPSLPPEMPKRLPPVIRLLLSRTPDIYKPAVAHAVFPPLGAHLWKVRFPYIDNRMHEATFMNVLMAGTGAGKDCISQPIDHIMADIRMRDAENLKREADWKKEVNSKGSNKDKRQRPEGLVIQEVDPDMTNPAFVMRMAEACEHFLYTKMNEIDQFDALRGSARGSQQFQIMCLAFDPDNRYGQTRVGTQSVTEKVCIRFNWNAATTIQKGQRYFARVLTDGPISRINFCTIPEREIGADMPVYGTYDSAFDEELRPFIDRLCHASGVIDCPQAFRLAKRLKDECADFARLSQSRVYENLSFRANVIAYLKACVLYICNDYRWSRDIEDFVRWSLQYDLYCKMLFFGEAIENANRLSDEQAPRRGPRNLLQQLPDTFTIHDAELIRQANGMDTHGTRNMLSQWIHRGYLLQMTDDSFEKSKNGKIEKNKK